MTLARLGQQDEQISDVEKRLGDSLARNIELTKTVESLSRQVYAVVCAVTPGTA
jgi:hypothetical protein